MRALSILLSVAMSARALSAQSFDQARSSLEADFKAHVFTTRIPLGASHVFYHEGAKRNQLRRVDTEVSPGGGIRYLAIGPNLETNGSPGFGLFYQGFYAAHDKIQRFPAGEKVKVTNLDWRNDRLELWLSTVSNNSYAKLKFMFGEGFQKTETRQSMLTLIARALLLEDFERLQLAEREYPGLLSQLDGAKSAFSAASGAMRLQAGEELRALLTGLERNRSLKAQQTHDCSTGEASIYAKEGADLDVTLKVLRDEARAKRISDIDMAFKIRDRQIDSLFNEIRTHKPSRAADWRDQEAKLAQVQRLMDETVPLLEERTRLGQTLSEEERARHDLQAQHLSTTRTTLDGQRPAIERLQADDDYRLLDRKLTIQRDSYTRAFGTPAFGSEASKYLVLLQQMYDNRKQVVKTGSPSAVEQSTALQKEIERTKARIDRSP